MDRQKHAREGAGQVASLLSIVSCARCDKACLIRSPAEPAVTYALATLRPASSTRGLCEECAAHWWLFTVDGLRWALQDAGPELLCLDSVQAEQWRVLGMMHPALARLDWDRMIDQWDLAWPSDWLLSKEGHNG